MKTIIVLSSTGPFEVTIDERGQIVNDIDTQYEYEVAFAAMDGGKISQLVVFYEIWNGRGGICALLRLVRYVRWNVIAATKAIEDVVAEAPGEFWKSCSRKMVSSVVKIGHQCGSHQTVEDFSYFRSILYAAPRIYEESSDARLNMLNALRLLLVVVDSVLRGRAPEPESGDSVDSCLLKIFDYASAAKACFVTGHLVTGSTPDTRSDEWNEARDVWEDHQVTRLAGIVHALQSGSWLEAGGES